MEFINLYIFFFKIEVVSPLPVLVILSLSRAVIFCMLSEFHWNYSISLLCMLYVNLFIY